MSMTPLIFLIIYDDFITVGRADFFRSSRTDWSIRAVRFNRNFGQGHRQIACVCRVIYSFRVTDWNHLCVYADYMLHAKAFTNTSILWLRTLQAAVTICLKTGSTKKNKKLIRRWDGQTWLDDIYVRFACLTTPSCLFGCLRGVAQPHAG